MKFIINSNISGIEKPDRLLYIKTIVAKALANKKVVILIILLPVIAIGLILFLSFMVFQTGNAPISKAIDDSYILTPSYTGPNTLSQIGIPEVIVRDKVNPLNGSLITTDQLKELSQYRPIMVVTDNQKDARPLSGLSEADLIYELPVEGGISRILAVYWSTYPKTFGPIRSFRTYFGELSTELGALIYHYGQAEVSTAEIASKPELKSIDSSSYFNEFDIPRVSCGGFRDEERIKNNVDSEHTLYSDSNRMRACTPVTTYKSNINITPLKYKLDAEYKDRSNNSSLSVKFGNADNISNYIYSRDENVYIRENSVDRNTSVSVKLKNLIVEEVPVTETYTENRLLSINLIGQGKAVFMFDGKVIEGIWQKDKRESRTKYFDKSGKEVEFNRGKTLISIVNKGSSYEAK
jgi:hypothetical protein